MKYWHLQMHLPYGRTGGQIIDPLQMLKEKEPVIGTAEWHDKQCSDFKEVPENTVVLVRRGQEALALCAIISDCFSDDKLEEKYAINIFRKVKVLEWALNYEQPRHGLFTQGTFKSCSERTEQYAYIDRWINNIKRKEAMETYIKLLTENKNLIFNGAPGTGKTYLAKQIAACMVYDGNIPDNFEDDDLFKQHCCFVQFHPSYDYTDFVEGLRPVVDENDGSGLGFERKDGVFKEFCAVAMKGQLIQQAPSNFDSAWIDLLDKVREGIAADKLLKIGSWNYGLSSKDSLKYTSLTAPSGYSFTITKKNVYDTYSGKQARPSGAFQKDMEDIVGFMKEECQLKDYGVEHVSEKDDKPFIFIIDEINRGEISKIFGELFFSIDPGYRGMKGNVKTQYQNMITDDDDPFKDGFYVPENVYIIGTMNDIDRSVECLDFAMRRRFAFKEITAEESADNMGIGAEARERMKRLNDAISSIDGLDSSYHIGASYFLNEEDHEKLWSLKLKGLLKEYLRGMSDAEENLKMLEKAYYDRANDN